jgi:predicted amidohydrolase
VKAGLVQLCSGDNPSDNLVATRALVRKAADRGAEFVLTPEVTNCVSGSRERQHEVLRTEAEDETLPSLSEEARALGIWLLIGSLALKSERPGAPFVNRSFLIGPDGAVVARYDKLHMFDVTISETETYRESAGYQPGDRAVLARTPFAEIGLTICYDLRFPHLYSALARAGAQILTVPAAFARPTGKAHWEPLLRARAIECGAFVLAPAQTGEHPTTTDRARRTHGHSLVVSPWGEVLADGGEDVGVTIVDLDMDEVAKSRARVPSLTHFRRFEGP